ncbi:MAG: hypothetical protein LC098_12385 [Burkholderiales bacterium]|nr:hypothetical protein [Burkholderiales bacterium]
MTALAERFPQLPFVVPLGIHDRLPARKRAKSTSAAFRLQARHGRHFSNKLMTMRCCRYNIPPRSCRPSDGA